ncbi:hypothetical protein [Luteococcus sp. OSA5]|uniref:hypothetical protein n=1 Tax=Luteococcus sp. OSA5 TaxID=3401630 RepID=UPI003B43B9F3
MSTPDSPEELDPRTAALFERALSAADASLEVPSPSEIRRRGSRRRARRQAVVTAGGLGTAAVIAALALPLATTVDPEHARVSPAASVPASSAPSPVTRGSAPPGPKGNRIQTSLGWGHVPGPELVHLRKAGDMTIGVQSQWNASASSPQYAVSACEDNRYALGQTSLLERGFSGGEATAQASVYEFDTTADAEQAVDRLTGWTAECPGRMGTNGWTSITAQEAQPVALNGPLEDRATQQASLGSITATSPQGQRQTEHNLVVQDGNRLAWISYTVIAAEGAGTAPEAPAGLRRATEVAELLQG